MPEERTSVGRPTPTWEEADAYQVPPEYSLPPTLVRRREPPLSQEETWSWPEPEVRPPPSMRPLLPRLIFGAVLAAIIASAATFLLAAVLS